jgi:hypothetical protein
MIIFSIWIQKSRRLKSNWKPKGLSVKTSDELMAELISQLPENIGQAVDTIARHYQDAQHHERWAVDQAMRSLLGDKYQQFIEAYEAPRGPKGERWVNNWDEGIIP